jgi:hypothetical protein
MPVLPGTAAGQNQLVKTGGNVGSRLLPPQLGPVSTRFIPPPPQSAGSGAIIPNYAQNRYNAERAYGGRNAPTAAELSRARQASQYQPTNTKVPSYNPSLERATAQAQWAEKFKQVAQQPTTAPVTGSRLGIDPAEVSRTNAARFRAESGLTRVPSLSSPSSNPGNVIKSSAPSAVGRALPSLGRALGTVGKVAGGVGTAISLADQVGKLARDLPRLGREWADWAKHGFDPNWRGVPLDDPNYDEKAAQRDAGQSGDPRFDPKGKPEINPVYPEGQLFGAVGQRYNVHYFFSYDLLGNYGRQTRFGVVSGVFGPISGAPMRPYGDGGRTVGLYYAARPDGTGQTYYPIGSADKYADLTGGIDYLEPIGDAPPAPGVLFPPPGSDFDFSPDRVIVPGLNDDAANQGAEEGQNAANAGLGSQGGSAPQGLGTPFPTPTQSPAKAPSPEPALEPSFDPQPVAPPKIAPDPIPSPIVPSEIETPAEVVSPGGQTAPGTNVTINGVPLPEYLKPPLPSPSRRQLPVTAPNAPVTNVTINGQPVPTPGSQPTPTTQPTSQPGQQQSQQPQPSTVNKKDGTLNPPAEQPTPQAPTPGGCKDPCVQGLHDKADQAGKQSEIKVKVFKSCTKSAADGSIVNEVDFEEKTLKVPASEADSLKLLHDRIFALESAQCDAVAVASVPEWWAVRPGADRPQLAVIFANVLSTGKLGRSYWTLHIPHYNKPKGFKPSIPTYMKGDWQGTLVLTDNSKMVVNCESKQECMKVLNKLKILVPFELRSKNGKAIKPKILEYPNKTFKGVRVVPIRADFYSKGKENAAPDWSVRLRKKKA